jgi:two-component system, OmpR family, alkaline phosphatase synthesis response regulator PhoP
MPKRILLVEDEAGLALTLEDRLIAEGYAVEVAADGEQGLARALSQPRTPVLMLTARGQIEDKVVGLKLGADYYLVKPFHMSELIARVEALLRRGAPVAPPPSAVSYTFGDVVVDFRKAEVLVAGRPADLSAKELRLLRYFLEHEGATLSRQELLDAVWGWSVVTTTRTVDVHVAGLRRKLEADAREPRYIVTLHGLGYKFVGPSRSDAAR